MHFSTAFLTAGLLSTSALAGPLLAARQTSTQPFENLPWKLSDIFIYEAANATSKPSSVSFKIKDTNPGLEFNTHCSRTVGKGESLYDGQWRQCGASKLDLAWYLDDTKNVHISRAFVDTAVGPPGQDVVHCFGNWQLNPHPSEVRTPKWTGPLQGTNYTQGCMEVYCTEITA